MSVRFVVLHHEIDEPSERSEHWDLMIEIPGLDREHRLATWALDRIPARGVKASANKLENHRAHYLDYSGPLSGNRGLVMPIICGSANWISAPEADIIRVELCFEDETWSVVIERGLAFFS